MKCGDIEQSPGPQPKSCQSFPICCWNLNSISAQNFLKWSLLRAYIAMQNLVLHVYAYRKPILMLTFQMMMQFESSRS